MDAFYPARNEPCDDASERQSHPPHQWNGDLGDERYERWGFPLPNEQPEAFRIYRKKLT